MITEPAYRKQIDEWVDAHTEEMLEDLKTLIRIPSERGKSAEGMPYGEQPARAVAAMQELMDRYGLRTRNYENYCIAGDLDGAGEKQLDILAHLDVVPVSDTWQVTQPFEPLIRDGRIYGRGSSDDKGPAIAALYAIRAVKELGFALKGGVRLICGSDEECGSSDLEYYYGIEKEAPYTFSPDADYPLINIERGRLAPSFRAEGSTGEEAQGKCRVISLHVGEKSNVIPGRGEIVLSGLTEDACREAARKAKASTGASFTCEQEGGRMIVRAAGATGHAAHPDSAVNTATALLSFVRELPLSESEGHRKLLALARLWPHGDLHGDALGVHYADEESGELTMSLDIVQYDLSGDGTGYVLEGCFDCRAPICANDDNLTAKIRKTLEAEGIRMDEGSMTPPHYVSGDSELVQKLLDSYELYFGKRGEPVAIGGGTYVHELERGVAFGCAVPEVDNRMHGDDEFMEIPMLVISTKIFADAILRLCM